MRCCSCSFFNGIAPSLELSVVFVLEMREKNTVDVFSANRVIAHLEYVYLFGISIKS